MAKLKKPTKILLVDDHPLVRAGLTLRISEETDLQICGEAATEEEALNSVKLTQPDLMLIDISLKNGNGIELVKQIKSRYPAVKMLIVSGFQESLYAERALRAGALGYLNKQESNVKVIDAIRTVLAGKRYVSPELAQRLVTQAVVGNDVTKNSVDLLSNRELQIFRMIGDGLSSSAIADQLLLSIHTIDAHREHIKRKLELKNASELTRTAVQWVLENRS
jgi:DNA-binding NarL/FixJ family response regulator